MPVAFVQEASAASTSVTLGAAATAGNTLVVAVACLGPTSATGVTGVTLGGGADNFALVTPGPLAQDATSPNDYISVSVWADPNCAGGSTAIAVTGTGVLAVWAYEFSGLAGTADIAQVFAVSTYQDSWMASTAQTTVPAEAWVAITCAANQTATETLTVNNVTGWTPETAYNGTSGTYDWGAVSAYQTVNTVGAPAWSGNFSQPSFSVTVLVTFPVALPAAPAAAVVPGAPLASGVSAAGGSLTATGGVSAATQVVQKGTPVYLTPVGPKTGNYTAAPGQFVIVDGSSTSAVTITFPAAPADGSTIGVKLAVAAANAVIVQASGSDVFDATPPGTTQVLLTTTGATFIAQYHTGIWYTQSTGSQLPPSVAANTPLPSDLGLVAWSYDPAALAGTFSGVALPAGKVFLIACPVRATASCASIGTWITAAGAGLTSGQNFAGVYSATGTRLAVTADLTASWGSTGLFSTSFSAAGTLQPPYVWAAFLANGTTPPSLVVTGNQTAAWANWRVTWARFGTLAGPFTSLPASFSPSSITQAAPEYWAGLF